MHTPRAISYTALKLWKDPGQFFLERLAGDRRAPQMQSMPAAVGSAFDILVKAALTKDLQT